MQAPHDEYAICPECDLLVEIGDLPEAHKASCPRCGYVFTCAHRNAVDRMLVFAITAMICLVFSTLFDMVHMSVQGQVRDITLFQTVQTLFELDEPALAGFMLVVIIGLPTVFAGLVVWLAAAIKMRAVSPRTITLLRVVGYLRFWNMAEIFFLGILVSMVKVASMANVQVGFSFWSYALFNVCLVAAMLHVDKFQLARTIRRIARERQHHVTPA